MRILHRLVRLPLRLVPPEEPRRILSGVLRGALWIPSSSTHGCWLGTYERDVQHVLADVLEPGWTFFDIGANVGFYSLLGSRLVGPAGRVVAFEPLQRNVRYLHRHLELNRVHNVTVMSIALADLGGHGLLEVGDSPSMGTLSSAGAPVSIAALDDLMGSAAIPIPHALKIDVEGAESRVLRGAAGVLKAHQPVILLAAHGWRQREECGSLLEEIGYSLSSLRDGPRDGNYTLLAVRRAD